MIKRKTYCPTCQEDKFMELASDDCLYCLRCRNNPSHGVGSQAPGYGVELGSVENTMPYGGVFGSNSMITASQCIVIGLKKENDI